MNILFRGKSENGKFVYGDLVRLPRENGSWSEPPSNELNWWIANQNVITREFVKVDPDTVGQYTGKDTPNKQQIFDGDHIRWKVITREYQDHYGDNIPLGHYREFMGYDMKIREGIVTFKDSAYWVVDPNEDHDDILLSWIGYVAEFDEHEVIEYFEEDQLFREVGYQSIEDLIDSIDKIEVIGNIHDHPHLLQDGGAV